MTEAMHKLEPTAQARSAHPAESVVPRKELLQGLPAATEATHKLERAPSAHSAAHCSLLVFWNDTLRAVALRDRQALIVGRSAPTQLVIEDRSLSRTHARFSLSDGRMCVEDLGSTNGTQLNGQPLTGEACLATGDVVQLGAVEVRVSGGAPEAGHPSRVSSSAAFMRRLADEVERARIFTRTGTLVVVRHSRERPTHDLIAALTPVDRACHYAPGFTLLVLPERDRAAAEQWVRSFKASGSGPLAFGMVLFPSQAVDPEKLLALAMAAARSARPGGPVVWSAHKSEAARSSAPLVASDAMHKLHDLVGRVARTPLPVLVLGETGSGKELVARAMHEQSDRKNSPFKAVNCATLPENLLESVLFGHERGAFTGADRQATGLFEQAESGTVFLDEVGELTAQAQAALLRVLETKRIVRVGGSREIEVHARVVAATHRDLPAMVRDNTFREDLMYRLDAVSLRVPPLRERREEILPLARLFLEQAAEAWSVGPRRLSNEAADMLEAAPWPGNVRQLRNALERAVAVSVGETIEVEHLPPHLLATKVAPESADLTPPSPASFRSLPDRVRDFETGLIRAALEKAHGNQAQAARILGLPRRTLANKVHAYGLLD